MSISEQKIQDALDVLYDEGIQGYKPEYRSGIDRYKAIGKAIAYVNSNALNIALLAYSAWEEWNHHGVCSVLNWVFPTMHRMSDDSPADDYLVTLEQLQRTIVKRELNVFTDWNTDTSDYNIARYRVELVITKID